MLGPRSAVEWIMDRYQVRADKASGIVNDPNDRATEHDQPRYIPDLLKRVVTVSVETMKIVDDASPNYASALRLAATHAGSLSHVHSDQVR